MKLLDLDFATVSGGGSSHLKEQDGGSGKFLQRKLAIAAGYCLMAVVLAVCLGSLGFDNFYKKEFPKVVNNLNQLSEIAEKHKAASIAPSEPQEIKDQIDYAKLKDEMRSKFKLPPRVQNSSEEADTRIVLFQIEDILKSKKSFESKTVESAEIVMNRKMDISNLEYAIEHLGDCVPEIKEKRKKASKANLKEAIHETEKKIYVTPPERMRLPY